MWAPVEELATEHVHVHVCDAAHVVFDVSCLCACPWAPVKELCVCIGKFTPHNSMLY